MPEEHALPPLSLIGAPTAMLAIHALALAASTRVQSPPGAVDWAQQAWGPFNITAALLMLSILAYTLRRVKDPGADLQRHRGIVWGVTALDLALTITLAAIAFNWI